jgi:hypothetical protein
MNSTRVCCALATAFAGVGAVAAEPSATPSPASSAKELQFDHVGIVVTRDAPERAALERAGLKISPGVNRNDGQGTASIAAEFLNSYIELTWPDPTVSIAPGAERGAEKFKNRMNWRTSGWCPISIGLHRNNPATVLPFPTWTIAPDWMPKGQVIEILTARDDTKSPSFYVEPPTFAIKNNLNSVATSHPAGVERITEIQLVRPKEYQPVAAFTYLEKAGIFKSTEGKEWAIEVTFDAGRKNQTKDVRPDLPLVVHY